MKSCGYSTVWHAEYASAGLCKECSALAALALRKTHLQLP